MWAVVLPSGTRPVAMAATDLYEPASGEDQRVFLVGIARDPGLVAACAAAVPRA